EEDVPDGHERDHLVSDADDAPRTAEYNEAEEARDDESSDPGRGAERDLEAVRDVEALHAGGEHRVEHERRRRRNDREPLLPEALLDVIGNATSVLAANAALVDLCERRLCEGGCATEQRHDDHPEE